jgi:hypothetical protein
MTGRRNLTWTALALALLAGLVQVGMGRLATDTATDAELGEPDCRRADSAAAAQLQSLLARNRSGDAGVIERAVHGLNVARKHCQYGWSDKALDSYRWLERWIEDHR